MLGLLVNIVLAELMSLIASLIDGETGLVGQGTETRCKLSVNI